MILVVVIITSGCAVTTIDVDAYKGPLANDQDVQTEQTVAMAFGAKPLLIQLRDRLEWGDNDTTKDARGVTLRDAQVLKVYNGAGSMGREFVFASARAREVDDVLTLYEDLPDDSDGMVRRVREFRSNLEILDVTAQDSQLWGLLKQQFTKSPGLDLVRDPQKRKQYSDRIQCATARLQEAYHDYISPPAGKVRGKDVFFARAGLLEALKAAGADMSTLPNDFLNARGHLADAAIPSTTPTTQDSTLVPLPCTGPVADGAGTNKDDNIRDSSRAVVSANMYYDGLRNGRVAETDLGFLTANSEVIISAMKRIQQLSDAYFNAREQLEQLTLLALQNLSRLPKPSEVSADRRIRANAILLARLVQPFYLWAALYHRDAASNHEISALRTDLLAAMPPEYSGENYGAWHDSPRVCSDLEEAFQQLALANSAKFAFRLTAAHDLLKSTEEVCIAVKKSGGRTLCEDYPQLKWQQWYRFGVVRGPGPIDSLEATIDIGHRDTLWNIDRVQLIIGDAYMKASSIGSFHDGRGHDGLATLAKDYVDQLNISPRNASLAIDQKVRLLEELARFAEKVLFVANYGALLGSPKGFRFDHIPFLQSSPDTQPVSESTVSDSQVLQAVGNSILTQVDELRRNARATHNNEFASGMEVEALRTVKAKPDSNDAIGDGLTFPTGGYAATQEAIPSAQKLDRLKVVDELIAKLKYEYDQALHDRGEGDQVAVRLKQTLTALYDQRADMIAIRPPASYLRNSYPITSLQHNTDLQWHNMLEEQQLKGVPFSSVLMPLLTDWSGKQTRNAEINAEIDKTFWQNINRIRVVGSGRTNQVIVKDDIGNWYVKGFSADPRDAIESAREMAVMLAGGPVSSSALEAAMQGEHAIDQSGSVISKGSAATQPSALAGKHAATKPSTPAENAALHGYQQQQASAALVAYEKKCGQISRDIDDNFITPAAITSRLTDAIRLAWLQQGLSGSDLNSALSAADRELRDSTMKKTPTTQPADLVVRDKLQAIEAYRTTLLRELFLPTPTSQPCTTQAAALYAAATQSADLVGDAADAASKASAVATRSAASATQAASSATQAVNADGHQSAASIRAAIQAATQHALETETLASQATTQASTATQWASASTLSTEKVKALAAAITQPCPSAKPPTATQKAGTTTSPSDDEVVETKQTSTTRTFSATTSATGQGVEEISSYTVTRTQHLNSAPTFQGPRPTTQDSSMDTESSEATKQRAFRIAAKLIRDRLKDPLNDALGAAQNYESELSLIAERQAQ